MSEMSLVSAKRAKLDIDSKKGNVAAKRALKLSENPDGFLSTVQVGITLIGILTGMVSGEAFSADLAVLLSRIPVFEPYAMGISEAIIVILVTYCTLIFGELVPKRIGMIKADGIAKLMASPMIMISKLAYPIVWILTKSTAAVVGLFRLNEAEETKVTEEEIKAMVQESLEDGEIEPVEHDIVERVFNLGDRGVSSIMTHRMEVVFIDMHASVEEIKRVIKETPYSSYPIIDGSVDDIVGITTLKLIVSNIEKPDFDFKNIILTPPIIHSKTNAYKALELLKKTRMEICVVVDDYGGLVGVVTLKDILEGLVGNIPQVDEQDEWVARDDGSVLVDGQYSFFDFLESFEMEDLWDDNNFDTIGGLIISELKSIPKTGDRVEWNGFEFEIIDMDGMKIDKILVNPPNKRQH